MNNGLQNIQPRCLYNLSLLTVTKSFERFKTHLLNLCSFIITDAFYVACSENRVSEVWEELGDFKWISKMLGAKRNHLHTCFQRCVNFNSSILSKLIHSFADQPCSVSEAELNLLYETGLELSVFLSDGGWYMESTKLLAECERVGGEWGSEKDKLLRALECQSRKLHECTRYSDMKGACEAYGLVCWLVTIVERMDKEGRDVLVEKEIMEKEDGLYRAACRTMEEVVGIENEEDVERGAEKTSSLKSCAIREKIEFISIGKMGWGKGGVVDKCVHYARCGAFLQAMEKFDQAFEASMLAFVNLTKSHSKKSVMEVLIQAARACEAKGKYTQAELIIKYVLHFVRHFFGDDHLYSVSAFEHLGFILTSLHQHHAAFKVLKTCLHRLQCIFPGPNLRVALVLVEFAYSCYFRGYTTASFENAYDCSLRSIKMMNVILPSKHPHIASATRLQALLLDETYHLGQSDSSTLHLHNQAFEASSRHLSGVSLVHARFCDDLGRHHTVTGNYEKAKKYFTKAIEHKRRLMGESEDLALSLAHLASLYTYALQRPHEAELLYKQSVDILAERFGTQCIVLQQAYSGLAEVYRLGRDVRNMLHYQQLANQLLQMDRAKREDNDVENCDEVFLNFDLKSLLRNNGVSCDENNNLDTNPLTNNRVIYSYNNSFKVSLDWLQNEVTNSVGFEAIKHRFTFANQQKNFGFNPSGSSV